MRFAITERRPANLSWNPEKDHLLQRGTNDTMKPIRMIDDEAIRHETEADGKVSPWINFALLSFAAFIVTFLLAIPSLLDAIHHVG